MSEISKEFVTLKFKKDALWKYATVILAVVVILLLVFNLGGNSSTNTANVGNNVVPSVPSKVTVNLDGDAVLGNNDAPVTIVEFSDYQCPFCRKFWVETLPLIEENYIATGKVRFIYKDFPLSSIHPSAQIAAEAAECARDVAGDDATYYKMHDKIFSEQNILDGGSSKSAVTKTVVFTADDLVSWAESLGYDIQSCLSSGKFADEVQEDLSDGIASGAQGTPYFVINGKVLSGAQPFSAFKAVIDAELNK